MFLLFVEGKQISTSFALGLLGFFPWWMEFEKKKIRFSKALIAKLPWHLIFANNLWTKVMYKKYIVPRSILEWIRDPDKRPPSVSIIWKVVIQSFDLIG